MKAYLMIALVAAGCGGSSAVNVTKMVGPSGGTVSHSDGTSVTIPMGALSTAANITITSINAPAPAGTVIVGPAYDFGPDGTVFASPVTITLPFETSKIPTGRTANDVVIYTAARGSTNYTALPTGIGSGTATTTTSHFTVYLPAVVKPGTVADMGKLDGSNSCSPTCTEISGGCSCSETCSSTTITLTCLVSSSTTGTTGSSTGTTGSSTGTTGSSTGSTGSSTGSTGSSTGSTGSTTGSGGSINCFCEINGQTQSSTPHIDSCSDQSALEAAFSQCSG